ncbi:MAG: hypothetical protein A2Y25_11055 [Candidatus Melainabacteria bacterium GWF2_37_15]|nr:MAG: hypothetical protein A2Y25_11055 [Candidatus Melainabacteria bacterium GWF2_37_15]
MQNQFQRSDYSELDNISLTALRIIYIFNMLLKSPCDDKEINQKLKEQIEDSRELSKDTICIYLHTLRLLGCAITRPTRTNNFKYVLLLHPFKFHITKKEMETLMELRKYVSSLCEWKTAVEIDDLFDTISAHLTPSTKKLFHSTQKSSLSREITSNTFFHDIKQLEKYCKQNKTLTLLYNSPESGEKNITLAAEKITMENGAFYIWGYNEDTETTMYLRLDRILDIKSVSLRKNKIKPKLFTVKYKLQGKSTCEVLSEEDFILEKKENEIIVESKVRNKFRFFQKILSYGNECTIIDPPELKEEITTKLKNMLRLYNDSGIEC